MRCTAPPSHTRQVIKGKPVIFKAEPRVFAFDIETTKAPLKFPDAEIDQVCACVSVCSRERSVLERAANGVRQSPAHARSRRFT